MTFWAMLSRLTRGVFLKYETLILIALIAFVYLYIINGDNVRLVIERAKRFSTVEHDRHPIGKHRPSKDISYLEKLVFGSNRATIQWEFKDNDIGIYSIQGRRPHMEDRYDYADDTNKSGITFYGVYDGHGGTFASEFAEKLLSQTVIARINRSKYTNTNINYSQVLIEEILSLDEKLLTVAKSNNDVAGSTAIVAILSEKELTVANVGDSRGVICDEHGNAIPMSYDHKPQLLQERRRIKKAGGFISFNGVWRVAGILATSRALGDFPLKEHKYIVADPDIQTFDLTSVKPQFMILATDGLWDVFTNDEAVQFLKDRLDEPHLGAKSLVLQAYYRGSFDNITVMVVRFNKRTESKVEK